MGILAWIILGIVVGAIARAILGNDKAGCLPNLVLGVVGALFGGFIGRTIFDTDLGGFFNLRTWVLAILGSVIVLFVWGILTGKKK